MSDTKEELISVIVPVYKVEKYLKRCVESIVNQTYRNLEIILVDDGSPDRCGEMCEQFAHEDDRIKVIHKENGGLSDARNAGLEIYKGSYVVFVDSDDWLDADMIEILYKTLKKNKADIAECSYRNYFCDCIKEETECNAEIVVGNSEFALESMLDWKYFKPNAWNKLYKRSVIADIRYPKGKLHEDEFTTYKYIYNAERLVYVDVSKYNYDRRRTDSITGEKFREANLDACLAFRERMYFLQEKGISSFEKKMNDIYCWVVLDRLYKCYLENVNGPKVKQTIDYVKRDLIFLKSHDVDPWYITEFEMLSRNFKKYCKVRQQREQKMQKQG